MSEKAKSEESYDTEIGNFLDSLYEGQKGYVYTPVKQPDTGYWQTYFFKWPEHRMDIITHMIRQADTGDVYVSPSLFKAPTDKKQGWKGSNYVWIEFDGNAPKDLPEGIPQPSIRIQSSTSKHEHWYWRLDKFQNDYRVLEGLSKQLTYTLDADKSGWDCSQVLRAPGTLHHESSRRVRLLSANSKSYKLADFKNLVAAPDPVVIDSNFDDLPDIQDVIAKYSWPKDATDLFHKTTQPVGSRSAALTRLGFHCVEMGMTNEECYVVLYNADERWGKFKNREDRAKRLIGLITHCRGKKALDAELRLVERESLVTLGDFRTTELKITWIFQDLITERGLGIISSAPGVGKSTLSIRLGFSVVLNEDFLLWKCTSTKQRRVAFLSMEMAGVELKKMIFDDMYPSLSAEKQEIIDRHFTILPLGYGMSLADKKNQQWVMDELDKHEIDFLIIDSLKAVTALDERKLDQFFDWINKDIRDKRGVTVWLVHHNRKPPNEGPRKPRGLEDLYGDTFITAHPTTVISLWRRSKSVIEVIPLKIRLAEEHDPFTIKRGKNLTFTVEQKVSIHDEDGEVNEVDSNDTGKFGQA